MIKVRLALVGALAAGSLSGCGVGSLLDYGCSDRDVRLGPVLAQEPVLAEQPDGAIRLGDFSGCDDDDGFAYAGRSYRSDLSRDEVLTFYRAAAEKHGWTWAGDGTPVPSTGLVISAAQACFTKVIDDADAHLSVWFPADFNGVPGEPDAPADEYGLDLRASHDGAAWC
ncbi:hypothetical protein JIG36_02885 [Actinoplanes sp. LDG1-06]|uniref:Lipoprotein n=1 Tax=Paractinoplanes ovalisporus TaxID=2810368 RepID=A0ABS2A3S7_9ACTN|nr:hypothetical protein [Actinoplanes ovalisporus]MBM2614502.1 hypothetical protein [Actinoplanes ovalisporus]